MFTLGIRIWIGKEMAYPSRFSVLTDLNNNVSSMRAYVNDVRYDSKTSMFLTPGIAINGEIYELDIIAPFGQSDCFGVVEFDRSIGGFVAKINGEPIIMNSKMDDYEIVGNIFEDWEEFKDKIPDKARFEALKEANAKEVEEAELLASQKKEKERVKKEKQVEVESAVTEAAQSTEKPEEVKIENKNEDNNAPEESPNADKSEAENINIEPETTEPSEKDVKVSSDEQTEPLKEDVEPEKPAEEIIEQKEAEETPDTNPSESEKVEETPVDSKPEEPAEIEADIDLPENDFEEGFREEELSPFQIFDQELAEEELVNEEPEEPVFEFEDEEEELINIRIFIGAEGQKTPAKGSFSYIMQYGEYERIDSGAEENTTKQRMELSAIIYALEALTAKCNVKICTTSQYLIVPFIKGWITRWKANNWRKDSGEEIKNRDLWSELYSLYAEQNIEWEFIKPGSSIVEILRCADMAKEALAK